MVNPCSSQPISFEIKSEQKLEAQINISMTIENLVKASWDSDLETVKYIIDNGIDVNSKNKNGLSPLWIAVYAGNNKVVKYLIDKGADVNIMCDDHGWTPLDISEIMSNYICADLLRAHGAKTNLELSQLS